MAGEPASNMNTTRSERVPPYSEEAEKGVLGSILLNSVRVMDLCIENKIAPESFMIPAHRIIYEAMGAMSKKGMVIDVLTLTETLKSDNGLDRIGGAITLESLVDSTPTAAHAEFYIDIVRQKHLLREVIRCARDTEVRCFDSEESADVILSHAEQDFLNITENQHGSLVTWKQAVGESIEHIEQILTSHRGLTGISTGFSNLDKTLQGMRPAEMIVLAARPSMGKTSLAMNIAEHVALGTKDPEKIKRPVGVFSCEMSYQSLATRMLCSHAGVSAFKLSGGYIPSTGEAHSRLVSSASVLSGAPLFVDDTGGLDVLELRARARRMKKKFDIQLIVIDYLQLLNSKEHSRQGRQIETSQISGNIKAMAKELKLPVIVLSQLSRAPEQRDKSGKPKLSDLRDSGAIEQDADVCLMLRRPARYDGDEEFEDKTLAIVDVAKNRNGPVGEVRLNFHDEYTRFTDRAYGTDGTDGSPGDSGPVDEVIGGGEPF